MTTAPPPPRRDGVVCACPENGRSPDCTMSLHAWQYEALARPAAPSEPVEPPAADSPTQGTETCRCGPDYTGSAIEYETCEACFLPYAAPSPVDTTEPPAEAQQGDEGRASRIVGWWHGMLVEAGEDPAPLAAERAILMDATMNAAARPSADTETLREVENDTIADTVLALADDFQTRYCSADYFDVGDAYDWLIAQAANIRGHQ